MVVARRCRRHQHERAQPCGHGAPARAARVGLAAGGECIPGPQDRTRPGHWHGQRTAERDCRHWHNRATGLPLSMEEQNEAWQRVVRMARSAPAATSLALASGGAWVRTPRVEFFLSSKHPTLSDEEQIDVHIQPNPNPIKSKRESPIRISAP